MRLVHMHRMEQQMQIPQRFDRTLNETRGSGAAGIPRLVAVRICIVQITL